MKTRTKLVKELDAVFSKYIRYSKAVNGMCTCFTCDRVYEVKKIQCGHFMSRKNYSTRWEENNVAPQCYGCNVMQQGKQFEFGLRLGKELSEQMYLKSKETVKFADFELQEKIDYYKKELKKFL